MTQADPQTLRRLILEVVPADGSGIGNQSLYEQVKQAARHAKVPFAMAVFELAREALLADGTLARGKGRGGSVRRAQPAAEPGFALQATAVPAQLPLTAAKPAAPRPARAKAAAAPPDADAKIVSYRHDDKRKNNPQVGLVNEHNDPPQPKTEWRYDPHLDPALQFDTGRAQIETLIDDALSGRPSGAELRQAVAELVDDFHRAGKFDPEALTGLVQGALALARGSEQAERLRAALLELKRRAEPYLQWTGKAERTSFAVDTVSLHVHERIDPMSILAAVRKRMDEAREGRGAAGGQLGLFAAPFESLPLREAIDFYRHPAGWSNRLVLGDSLLVMNSLLRKESMAGQVQTIYIDPPYGIRYGSNFQPFVHKRDVKDRTDADLTQEPETIKAFRDTWELGIHSYLAYLRDRLLLAKELLHESGSVFVQISDENLHHVRELLDEVFGASNLVSIITLQKTSSASGDLLPTVSDYIVWYARNRETVKFRSLYNRRAGDGWVNYDYVRTADGHYRRMLPKESSDWATLPAGWLVYRRDNLTSQRPAQQGDVRAFDLNGETFDPGKGTFKSDEVGLRRLRCSARLESYGRTLAYRRYAEDFPYFPQSNLWADLLTGGFAEDRYYVVQTTARAIERCLLMTTDPGDLVFDPTCGSGTTAFVAEKWGRRWISCDTSRVAITLAKQRLMTASFDYFELRYPHEGLRGGFIYKTVPHVTLKSIANNPQIDEIHERMHPAVAAALADLNAALKQSPPAEPYTVAEGGRKGQALKLGAAGMHTLPSGERVPAGALLEWEVPFDFPPAWPDAARPAFDAFHAARQAKQRAIDASIAAHADTQQLYDQPEKSKTKLRIAGPFTVEAVPFASVLALDETQPPTEADASVARTGESSRQHNWRDELLRAGIRGKGGQKLAFASLEPMAGTQSLHCTGVLATGERVVVSFGPEHAALEQRQVEHALNEAERLRPAPKFIVFCAFTFDPEAAKDIDETDWPGIALLKVQMNTDLLTEDLKKARASNESFWLMGQPDVDVRRRKDGRYEVEVNGFDYFDTVRGELIGGGKGKIAMWLLDPDYDGRSLYPRQVFFPMAGKDEGWGKLKATIRAELNEAALAQFAGTVSLPFEPGQHKRVAVKIVDDRGIESLKIVALD